MCEKEMLKRLILLMKDSSLWEYRGSCLVGSVPYAEKRHEMVLVFGESRINIIFVRKIEFTTSVISYVEINGHKISWSWIHRRKISRLLYMIIKQKYEENSRYEQQEAKNKIDSFFAKMEEKRESVSGQLSFPEKTSDGWLSLVAGK